MQEMKVYSIFSL